MTDAAEAQKFVNIPRDVAIWLAILAEHERYAKNRLSYPPSVYSVSGLLLELINYGVGIKDLALAKTCIDEAGALGNVYSEDVELAVGHSLAEGHVAHRKPLVLTIEGEKRIKSNLRFFCGSSQYANERIVRIAAVKAASSILNLDLGDALLGIG